MKRTMIYLSDEIRQGLRKLAFESNISIAELVRRAVDAVYGEDIEDIRIAEEEIANYQAHPESAISLAELRRQKKVKNPPHSLPCQSRIKYGTGHGTGSLRKGEHESNSIKLKLSENESHGIWN